MQLLVNAYYLQEEAARGRLDLVDETLAKCARMGIGLVRAWAFNDDPNKVGDSAIQRGRLDYCEGGLCGLDRLLERARAHGLRLILPLVNFWNAYGGARQWLRWNGIPDAVEGDARFFTDAGVRDHYARHVEAILGRLNPLSGVRYGEDPTVFAWELMNEPRGAPDDWIAAAAAAVKRAAPRARLSLGDESGGGRACPDLDFVSCHYYPEKYGVPAGSEEWAGCAFLSEHARAAAVVAKPLLVGELGLRTHGLRGPERARIYRRWLEAAHRLGAAAVGPWLFAYDSRPEGWDDFTFYAADPVARMLADYAAAPASTCPPPSR